jgi:hypothetical protein
LTRIKSATIVLLTAACVILGLGIIKGVYDLALDCYFFRLGYEQGVYAVTGKYPSQSEIPPYWDSSIIRSAATDLVSRVIVFLACLISLVLVRTHRKEKRKP